MDAAITGQMVKNILEMVFTQKGPGRAILSEADKYFYCIYQGLSDGIQGKDGDRGI
jgi:hypothetical protein